MNMTDKQGWLQEQLNYAKSQTENWPEWKRESMFTPSVDEVAAAREKKQNKEAAKRILERANSLDW